MTFKKPSLFDTLSPQAAEAYFLGMERVFLSHWLDKEREGNRFVSEHLGRCAGNFMRIALSLPDPCSCEAAS